MLHNAFANLKGQVQAGKIRITLLELLNDPESMKVVIKAIAVAAHDRIQGALAGVAEWRMANVVNQGQCLHQVFIQGQLGGDGAGDLGHLDSVREAVAKVIGITPRKDLGLVLQPAESAGMDHAVTVALKIVAVGMARLRIATSTAIFGTQRVGGEHDDSLNELETALLGNAETTRCEIR